MSQSVSVYLLPSLAAEEQLADKTVAVIDVLRATTTITHALAAGAQQVIPCLETDEARRLAAERGDDVLLGGERGGVKIEGFDLGNSPSEYTSEAVAGKTIVFTTTNGTKAMYRCRQASRVLLASFNNYSAVGRQLAKSDEVAIVCAGTDGEVTREDVLLAGAMVVLMGELAAEELLLNDSAQLAADAWRSAMEGDLTTELRASLGGRNLTSLGLEADIEAAAVVDQFKVVPVFDAEHRRIYLP